MSNLLDIKPSGYVRESFLFENMPEITNCTFWTFFDLNYIRFDRKKWARFERNVLMMGRTRPRRVFRTFVHLMTSTCFHNTFWSWVFFDRLEHHLRHLSTLLMTIRDMHEINFNLELDLRALFTTISFAKDVFRQKWPFLAKKMIFSANKRMTVCSEHYAWN